MQNIDWTEKRAIAKKMTTDELKYAIVDCGDCIRVMGVNAMYGKDAGYYSDEASIYEAELAKREKKVEKIKCPMCGGKLGTPPPGINVGPAMKEVHKCEDCGMYFGLRK